MYLDHMTDEEAGKLFKIMLSLRNGRDVEIPADFKFIMTHIQKFWDDQDVSYQKSVEWWKKWAEVRRGKKPDEGCIIGGHRVPYHPIGGDRVAYLTDTVTDTNTDTRTNNNSISNTSTTHTSVWEKKTKRKIQVINHYSSDFESFWWSYPKRKGKARAWEARLRCIDWWLEPSYLISKASDYAKECSLKHVEDKFIKRPQGWLNDARYDDDFFTGSKPVDLDAISDGLDSVFND